MEYTLVDINTGQDLRPATAAEARMGRAAARRDGGVGALTLLPDGRVSDAAEDGVVDGARTVWVREE